MAGKEMMPNGGGRDGEDLRGVRARHMGGMDVFRHRPGKPGEASHEVRRAYADAEEVPASRGPRGVLSFLVRPGGRGEGRRERTPSFVVSCGLQLRARDGRPADAASCQGGGRESNVQGAL